MLNKYRDGGANDVDSDYGISTHGDDGVGSTFSTPSPRNNGAVAAPPSSIRRLINFASRLSLHDICPHTGVGLVTTPLRKMSAMFMRTILSLKRQRDAANGVAFVQTLVGQNMAEKRDKAVKRNVQLEFEKEAAVQRLKCAYCNRVPDERYAFTNCGHQCCFECLWQSGKVCLACGKNAVKRNKWLLKLKG